MVEVELRRPCDDRPNLDPPFIEDNWQTGRIGDASFDATAGSIDGMFAFGEHPHRESSKVILDPTSGSSSHH